MTKVFLKSGGTIRVHDSGAVQAYDNLPAETYTVKFDERAGEFFLEQIENFTLPKKIYGTNVNHSKRILTTFDQRPGSTGVLLSGIKGAGKTLLGKQVAVAAREQGYPTIVINKDWHGDEFNAFIQSITTPAVILFDEFEKIYDYHTQRKILTLFDGVFPSRKLFIVTTNTERETSEFMRNRPGRIYYNFEFNTLGQDFIAEFLEDRLEDKSQIPAILKYTQVFSFFNFDMLNAAVEEMNRYGETLADVLEVLNIKPENRSTDTYKLEVDVNGERYVIDRSYGGFQPNNFEYTLWADSEMPKPIENVPTSKSIIEEVAKVTSNGDQYIAFDPTKIESFDQMTNTFTYTVEAGNRTVKLFVTRNDPLDKWKYHPDAY
jgi:hypothetical protein